MSFILVNEGKILLLHTHLFLSFSDPIKPLFPMRLKKIKEAKDA